MPEAMNGIAKPINYGRYSRFLLGAVVIVWLLSAPIEGLVEAFTGFKVDIDTNWTAALNTMAVGIIGALLKDLISPTREGEQEIAKLEATTAAAEALSAMPAKK